jgi:hypothetical protein
LLYLVPDGGDSTRTHTIRHRLAQAVDRCRLAWVWLVQLVVELRQWVAHPGLAVACEMPSPLASKPATPAFKGSPRPRMCAWSPRNSPMETSLPSRGAFGDATCRTDRWWGPGPVDGSLAIRSQVLTHSITMYFVASRALADVAERRRWRRMRANRCDR